MKLRSFLSVLTGVVLTLLLVGAAGAYWLATSSAPKLQQTATNPSAAMFVSRQAAAMVSLLANPDRLESFWLAQTPPEKRRPLKAELDRLQQSLFANTALNYERDLKPWLGNEITFVLTAADVNRDPTDGMQPGYLLVLTADDPQLAQKSVQAFWQRQAGAKDLIFEQFAGVQLIHADGKKALTSEQSPSFTSAVVGNFVLFANYPKVLRDALNHVQVPELSLEQSFTYQQALEKVAQQRLGLVFLNFPQLGNWLTESPSLPAAAPLNSRYEGLIAAIQPDPQGLLAETILLLTPGATPLPRTVPADLGSILQLIPGSSNLAIVGKDLQQAWTQWQSNWANQPWSTRFQPWLALQERWGTQLSEAVLNAIRGDYAIAQVPVVGQTQPDWVFATQRLPETEAALDQLDQVAQQQGVSIGSFPLNDQKIEAWTKLSTQKQLGTTSLQAEVQGVRTTVGAYEIFATSLGAMEQALQATEKGLAASSDLQTAMTQIKTPNQGYLYLNQKALDQLLPAVGGNTSLKRQVLARLRSALITSYDSDETGLRGALVLHLKGV